MMMMLNLDKVGWITVL